MHADLEELAAEYEGVLSGWSAEDCQRHPVRNARRWNAQEIVAHLVLTHSSTVRLLRKRLEAGRPAEGPETLTHRFLQWMVIRRGYFPNRAKAPEFTLPEKAEWRAKPGAELTGELRAGLEELDGTLDECEAAFGENFVGSHFVFGPLTAREWRRLHRVHGLHHLKQVKVLPLIKQ